MQSIKNNRLISQHLVNPRFSEPKDVVLHMGAIQAQNYDMAKWAVGIRTISATEKAVEEAFNRGDILRTHVMRPTWHFVAAEDIRWMLKLSAQRIKQSSVSRDKDLEIDEKLYTKVNLLIEKMLRDNNYLTREEVSVLLFKAGILVDTSRMIHFMMRAEVEGIVCSGPIRGKKQTYALIDERTLSVKDLQKDESLATLASKYFRSHSPASLQDFVWWSGLSVSEAREAIKLIDKELIADRFHSHKLFVHESLGVEPELGESVHFLPAFDEYVISYKERGTVLDMQHQTKAYTKNGIFYPIVVHNGEVVGSWKKQMFKKQVQIETDYFTQGINFDKKMQEKAQQAYKNFIQTQE